MPFFSSRRGLFHTGPGGTYPVNDGDTQNDVDDDEIPEPVDHTDEILDAREAMDLYGRGGE